MTTIAPHTTGHERRRSALAASTANAATVVGRDVYHLNLRHQQESGVQMRKYTG